jgi:hypothetical protein
MTNSTTDSDPLLYFQFEADFIQTLRCIPLSVRYKLDTCGVKLKLNHWHQFSVEERQQCLTQACHSPETIVVYRDMLQGLVLHYTDQPAATLEILPNPPWENGEQIPAQVLEQTMQVGRSLSLGEWQALSLLQRFTLIKLSQPGHENRNFVPALDEFIIGEGRPPSGLGVQG